MARKIYLGTSRLKKTKLNLTRVKKIYLGTVLSWQDKSPGFVNLSVSSMSVGTRKTGSFNINSSHGGALSVACTGNVSAIISGSTVVVTGASSVGSGTVTVTCAGTEEYLEASATVSVSVYQSSFSVTVHGAQIYEGGYEVGYDHYFTGIYLNTWGDILSYEGAQIQSTNTPYPASWAQLVRSGENILKTLTGREAYGRGQVFIDASHNWLVISTPIVDGAYYTSTTDYI